MHNMVLQDRLLKVAASVFWDTKGRLLINYLPKGQAINAECYAKLRDQVDKKQS